LRTLKKGAFVPEDGDAGVGAGVIVVGRSARRSSRASSARRKTCCRTLSDVESVFSTKKINEHTDALQIVLSNA
jgi:hypothetical protein